MSGTANLNTLASRSTLAAVGCGHGVRRSGCSRTRSARDILETSACDARAWRLHPAPELNAISCEPRGQPRPHRWSPPIAGTPPPHAESPPTNPAAAAANRCRARRQLRETKMPLPQKKLTTQAGQMSARVCCTARSQSRPRHVTTDRTDFSRPTPHGSSRARNNTALNAWFCIDALTRLSTASHERNATIVGANTVPLVMTVGSRENLIEFGCRSGPRQSGRRQHQLSRSIQPGSSIDSLILTRNCTASRPSTSRWS